MENNFDSKEFLYAYLDVKSKHHAVRAPHGMGAHDKVMAALGANAAATETAASAAGPIVAFRSQDGTLHDADAAAAAAVLWRMSNGAPALTTTVSSP